jgi:4-hydroxy-3-polyprenylbenzoate decarboxylase
MAYRDLRGFLTKLEDGGDLKRVSGAHWDMEIGVISELSFEHQGPSLLFGDIPDYPPDYRVVTNLCSTLRRALLALEMDPNLRLLEAMKIVKERHSSYKPVPPTMVSKGPVLDHEFTGDEIDLLRFPVPRWHEKDGGRYIGTGDCVILRDPDTGRVNVGTYRLEIHDRSTTGIWQGGAGNDGAKIIRKYWAKEKPAPVAATFGQEPILFCASSGWTPPGVPEYEYAGFIRGEPIEVVEGKVTGLPIPATAEIAIEGDVPPPESESRDEGPFGEYTGYYMLSEVAAPIIRIKALYHRDSPILLGAPPFKPVSGEYVSPLPIRTLNGIWRRLEEAGLRGILGVDHLASLGATVIQVLQESEDQVERIMDILSKIPAPQRLTIIVDDDIDIEDAKDVLWAVGTRCDPATAVRVDTIETSWVYNPLLTLEQRKRPGVRYPFSRLVINACRPYKLRGELPPVNVFSEKLRRDAWNKWGKTIGVAK